MTTARPLATYRLQVHAGFTLRDAAAAVPHVRRLGASHLHLSPITAARPGSTHGYDVIDSSVLSDEIGGREALTALGDELKRRGMSILLDVVPNHEAASHLNRRWQDVLRHGPTSAHAIRYDIDWEKGHGQVLRPILGKPFGEALEAGDLSLRGVDDEIVVMSGDVPLPLDPRTWAAALGTPARDEPPDVTRAVEAVARAARDLPPRTDVSPPAVAARKERCMFLRARMKALLQDEAIASAIASRLERFHGRPGEPGSFDAFEALLRAQAWRLTTWTVASEDVNYRRFFDITDLVGIRAEDETVFEETHELALSLAREGLVQGFRIDHVDGLREPRAYLDRLSARLRDAAGARGFIVVEKILAADESLPAGWPVLGTTGYETLNAITGALIDPVGLARLQDDYAERTNRHRTLRQVCVRRKAQATRELLRGDERSLVAALVELAAADRHACDVTRTELREALGALTAALPAYRTYREPGRDASDAEVALVERAAREAATAVKTEGHRRALRLLRRTLLGPLPPGGHPVTRFVMRWQQFTGPVMAKGLEDTAFYAHVPLLAVNEVGGDVDGGRAFAGPRAYHARMIGALADGRPGLAPTSTHDTKRGEDARARLALLADAPARWRDAIEDWRRKDTHLQSIVRGRLVPDANERELLVQSLLGCWPVQEEARREEEFVSRFTGFLTKALRESKTNTSWLRPDAAHEEAVLDYARRLLGEPGREPLASFAPLADEVASAAVVHSLSQAILRATGPQAPEIYQGCQSWNHALVDPDNRRPVDHAALDRDLASIELEASEAELPALVRRLLESWPDGRIKLYVTWRALQARRRDPALFELGAHVPLELSVEEGDPGRALAYARVHEGRAALVVVPLGLLRAGWKGRVPVREAWDGVRVLMSPGLPGSWTDVLTGRAIESSGDRLDPLALWTDLPVALLVSH